MSVDVKKGNLIVFNDGDQVVAQESAPALCVAAVYEPTDLSDDCSLFQRWLDTSSVLSISNWLKQEVEAGRVKIFDQRYRAKQEKDRTPKQKVIDEINAMSISEADKEKLIDAFRAVLEASK